MQWHPSFAHIHITDCTATNLNPTEPHEPLELAHPQRVFPAAQPGSQQHQGSRCLAQNAEAEKKQKSKNLSHVPGLEPDWPPMGTNFLVASLQSLLQMPLPNASSSAPTLLPASTTLSMSQALPSHPTALPGFFCAMLHSHSPTPALPLFNPTANCTKISSLSLA